MRRRFGVVGRVAAAVVIVAAVTAVVSSAGEERANASPSDANTPIVSDTNARASTANAPSSALLARGAYVAKAADCAGCHTAPEHGAPWAGGLGMGSPFGTIVTSNITPDRRYGIGAYTLHDFERAIRHGVARGGKRLYPAMPYVSFSKLSNTDVAALYAYIMHDVAPVAKPTPPSDVAFPFNQRWALRFWQWAFVPRRPYAQKPERDAQWNRGAYLAQGAGHCGACHTPRGAAYQEKGYDETSASFLVGGINDHWFAPNLTGDPGSGLGRMSADEIAAFLKTGHGSNVLAYGSMVEQVEDSTQYLTDADLLAVAHYLKSLPAQQPYGGYTPGADTNRSPQNGSRVADAQSLGYNVYQGFCARCHRADGAGALPAFPALAGNPSVVAEDTTSLIRLLVEGGNSPATLTGPPRTQMPAFAGVLTDVQIAQALTYIRGAWGNDAQPVTANDVTTMRSTLHK